MGTEACSNVVRDSEDFRAGVAYAAHLLRHAVEEVHRAEPKLCCQGAVTAFGLGMAQGFEEYGAGTDGE